MLRADWLGIGVDVDRLARRVFRPVVLMELVL
jgi:hypothetical protein